MTRFAPRLLAATVVAPLALLAMPACAVDRSLATDLTEIHVETLAEGLVHPWGIAVLPDGAMLVTERPGTLRIVEADGSISDPIAGVPEVDARGQGGLLDVALHPDFAENGLVYLSYAEPGPGGNSTAVARGTLDAAGGALEGVEVIFSQVPKVESRQHFGSRLVFDREGYLFVGLGDRSAAQFRGEAQSVENHIGTLLRLHDDGAAPSDNPFVGTDGAQPEIWSYGHRNIQGAALHPETGIVWINEHGPRGGDEINIPEPGGNFGWPVVSHGVNYDGTPVGTGAETAEGMIDPLHHWTPSIAPSGMLFYTGDLFPEWQGHVFVGGLAATILARLELDGETVVAEEHMLGELGLRIREVEQGPDGALYVLTDHENGRILRITPADARSS